MSKLEAALAWASRGYRVFPLQANSKHPLDIAWTSHASADEAVIRAWWIDPVLGAERDYNIGWLTNGWIVADVDVKSGKQGLETAERLGLRIGETLTMRTPTGGFHLVFRGLEHVVSNSPLGLDVDIRSHHGFVLAPGSTIGGVPYVVHADKPVAEFPQQLRHFLKAPRRRADVIPADVDLDAPEAMELARHYLRQEAPLAIEGANGDDTAYRVACQVRDLGISEAQALELFLDDYNDRCSPPWSVDEAGAKVANAYRYATGVAGSRSPAAAFGHVDAAPPAGGRLRVVTGSALVGREIPARQWLIRDLIPSGTVTLLAGDGGTGKSLLAQQLAVAVATGRPWLGNAAERGGAVYLSAEDDLDEVHRRLADITEAEGLGLADLADLHVLPLAGEDAVLAAPDQRSDVVVKTPLWAQLVDALREIRPRLLVLDNLADVFAGNENARPQARQFIGMLRGLAMHHALTVLVISHPSLTGMSSGTGTSGSTAWSNSVRARLYLERVTIDKEEADPDLRVLCVKKANYAPVGAEIRMRWERGTFQAEGGASRDSSRAAAEAKAERVFLALLERRNSEGRYVSPHRSSSFAPTVFAKLSGAEGCGKAALERAMDRLLERKQIAVEKHGPPTKRSSRLDLVTA